jgi:hypothetical protein
MTLGADASFTSCPPQTNALTGVHATVAAGSRAGFGRAGMMPLPTMLTAVPDCARTLRQGRRHRGDFIPVHSVIVVRARPDGE